jgi:hypothetical protein
MRRVLNFSNPCLCAKCHGCIQLGKPNCDLNCEECTKPALVGCPGFSDKNVEDEAEYNARVAWHWHDFMQNQVEGRKRIEEGNKRIFNRGGE